MGCINQFMDGMEYKGGWSRKVSWGVIGEATSVSESELLEQFTDDMLRKIMNANVEIEEYERACIYRDELNRRESLKQSHA